MNIKVENDCDKTRIDSYLALKTGMSRSKIQKLIKEKNILVNDNVCNVSYIVKEGDLISIDNYIDEEIDINPEKQDIDILYEDSYLAIINKKSGVVVHPALGNYEHTLVSGLLYHFNNLSNDKIRPGIVHRLDKDTSGLMVVAKNDEVHEMLSNMIRKKEVERKYLALVWGVVKHDKGTIDAPIGRDINNRQKYAVTDINSKDSVTHFAVIKRYKEATLIECKLDTGRTHQIRVHMSYIGHPIVNDPIYSNKKIFDKDFGQMLHSKSIRFIHPITNKELYFEVEPPLEFTHILKYFED